MTRKTDAAPDTADDARPATGSGAGSDVAADTASHTGPAKAPGVCPAEDRATGPDTLHAISAAAQVFGYGSLVNRATHRYSNAGPAELVGWRRVWVHTAVRPVAYLSVRRDPGCSILGLVADVPGADWAALDLREHGYDRHPVTAQRHAPGRDLGLADRLPPVLVCPAQVYAVPEGNHVAPQIAHPILLSYLDTVVQGFLREFGAAGAKAFFATTEGWHAPIRNDRAAPLYPRAQRLTAPETAFVDAALEALGVVPV